MLYQVLVNFIPILVILVNSGYIKFRKFYLTFITTIAKKTLVIVQK